MTPAAFGESGLVSKRMQPLGIARRLRPSGTLRRRRQIDIPFFRIGNSHGESNPFPVRRPAQIGGIFPEPGELGRRPWYAQLQGKDLGAFRFTWGEERDAFTVGGPDCAGALREESVMRTVGIHNPDRRLVFVRDRKSTR